MRCWWAVSSQTAPVAIELKGFFIVITIWDISAFYYAADFHMTFM